MTINNITVKELATTIEECEFLEAAERLLAQVQCALGGENTIESCETAEVITPGEIARARSILTFIAVHRTVVVY